VLYVTAEQKKTYRSTLPNPSLYSYTITSYRTIYSRLVSILYAAAGSREFYSVAKKTRRELRENVASTCLLVYSLSYRLIIYFSSVSHCQTHCALLTVILPLGQLSLSSLRGR